MELKEAYEKAMRDPRVKTLVNKGFYLSSALINQTHLREAEKWILVFFNPDSRKVFSVTVDSNGISVSSVQEPLKEGFYKEMSMEGRENIQEILDLISSEFSGTPVQVLISAKPDIWGALIVGKNMKTLYLEIDVKTRKIVKRERGSLLG